VPIFSLFVLGLYVAGNQLKNTLFWFVPNIKFNIEELDGRGQCARRTIAEAKLHWQVIRWVTKNLLSIAPPCYERDVKPLVPASFADVSTHQSALDPRGRFWPVLLMCYS
jgi:hypothetical protein